MSSGNVSPINGQPQAWDQIWIGQTPSPGVCYVSEAKRKHAFDVKKGKGIYGATITYVNRPPAQFSVQFLLWLDLHFQQWDLFRALLKYDPTKKAIQAIDIYHPSLADIDLSSVVTEAIGNIVREGEPGEGLYSITVDFLEYYQPPKKSAVGQPTNAQNPATSSSTSNPGQQPPQAQDQQQAEIAQLMQKASQP